MRFNFNTGLIVPLELVAYRGSCLWILAEACNELAAAHRWSVTEAAWLILSGLAPDKHPVRTKWRHTWDHTGQPLTALVTVTAKHYVSGRTVARAFERARKMMLLASAPRPVGERALRLFEFVEDHRDSDQKKLPWSALMREWDRCARPGWAYQDRGHFMRDYLRARKLLVEEGGSRSSSRHPSASPGRANTRTTSVSMCGGLNPLSHEAEDPGPGDAGPASRRGASVSLAAIKVWPPRAMGGPELSTAGVVTWVVHPRTTPRHPDAPRARANRGQDAIRAVVTWCDAARQVTTLQPRSEPSRDCDWRGPDALRGREQMVSRVVT